MNFNPEPNLQSGKVLFWLIVGAPASDYSDLVATLNQRRSQFAEMLGGGYDVGVKRLVEQENLQ